MTDLLTFRDRRRFRGPTPTDVIVRGRLDHLFDEATGKIVRVLAPGGYGKSTLVWRWISEEPRPTGWLDLEAIDNDPVVFGDSLIRLLADLTDRADVAEAPDLDPHQTLAALLAVDRPFVIVLDDVHRLTTPASIELLDMLGEQLPPDSTLVLIGRGHDTSSIGRLRLRPGTVDVGVTDLAFDHDETVAMLRSSGLPTDQDVVARIEGQFEGWPAGLRLAALAVDASNRGDDLAWTRLSRASFVTEYVGVEWLGSLDPDDRVLLTEAGCLRRFSADMCDEVLGRSGSHDRLRALVDRSAILLPLDVYDDWYRMHPVLSGLLSDELRSTDRQRWTALHVGASAWWERKGDIDMAVDFAARAEAHDLYERLLVEHAATYITRGMTATVVRWLGYFDEQRLGRTPSLCAFAAITAANAGDGPRAIQLSRRLRANRPDITPGDPSAEVWYWSDVLRTAVEPCAVELTRALVQPPVDTDVAVVGPWRTFAQWAGGVSAFICGDEEAPDVLDAAMLAAEANGLDVLQGNLLGARALVAECSGERERSSELARAASELVSVQRLDTHGGLILITVAIALADARAGRHDRARAGIARFARLVDRLGEAGTWILAFGHAGIVRAHLLIDDVDGAAAALEVADRLLAGSPVAGTFADHVQTLHAEVSTAQASTAMRYETLTDAELRVLAYLPTNLSLADIARRLYVSRNTVKSHAAAIYRKLDATSRTSAVDAARRTGLLGPDDHDR